MSIIKKKTIRMLFPQWQGGNQELYSLGARLLAWLAPETEAPVFEVNVPDFKKKHPNRREGLSTGSNYSSSMMKLIDC